MTAYQYEQELEKLLGYIRSCDEYGLYLYLETLIGQETLRNTSPDILNSVTIDPTKQHLAKQVYNYIVSRSNLSYHECCCGCYHENFTLCQDEDKSVIYYYILRNMLHSMRLFYLIDQSEFTRLNINKIIKLANNHCDKLTKAYIAEKFNLSYGDCSTCGLYHDELTLCIETKEPEDY